MLQAGLILEREGAFVNERGHGEGQIGEGFRGPQVTSILRPECYTPPEKLCLRLGVGTADMFRWRLQWKPWDKRLQGH